MGILDQFKRLIRPEKKPADLVSAAGSIATALSHHTVAPNMTPDKLARILRDANQGKIEDLMTLGIEMAERDPHYFSLLQTRRLAITGAPIRVEAGEDEAGTEIAKWLEAKVIRTAAFRQLVAILCDAVPRGFAVAQPVFETATSDGRWVYSDFRPVDCRLFQFDYQTVTELRLRSLETSDGQALPPGLVVHFNNIRVGLPARAGLDRVAVVTWMFKTFTVNDWVAFAEVYGMPLRIGKYDPATAGPAEVAKLRRALANIGHDAAAVIPNDMEISIEDGGGRPGTGGGPFLELAEYFDKQLSKAVLGQTMTSDDGASLSQAQVHKEVQMMIAASDARAMSDRIMESVIVPIVRLNFGEQAPVPEVCIDVSEPEDLAAFTAAVIPWIEKAGLEVSAKQIRDKYGLEEPEDEADTLGAPEPPPAAAPGAPGAKPGAGPAKPKVAANSVEDVAGATADVVEAERLTEMALRDWRPLLVEHKDTIEALAAQAETYDQFLELLAKFPDKVDSNEFLRRLAIETTKARLLAASSAGGEDAN